MLMARALILHDPAGPYFTLTWNQLQILVLHVDLKILIYTTTPNSSGTSGTYLVSEDKGKHFEEDDSTLRG